MFLHLSVSHSVHGGSAPTPHGQTPQMQTPRANPPWMQTPQADPQQTPPMQDPPNADPPGIRQQAGGTHPIGMHTCSPFVSHLIHSMPLEDTFGKNVFVSYLENLETFFCHFTFIGMWTDVTVILCSFNSV